MNMKSMNLLMAMTLLNVSQGNSIIKSEKTLSFNERKKCFRKDCTNHRKGNSLYCSTECQTIYHNYLKEQESK